MLSLFLIILGHMAYGITNSLWKGPRDRVGTLPLILMRSFGCCVIFFISHLLFAYFQVLPAKEFSSQDILYTVLICMVNYFGLFFYLKSLKHTDVSNVIGFGKMGLIIGILIGVFFYGESIGMIKASACAAILLAVTLIEKSIKIEKTPISKGLVYSILSRLFWSTGLLFVPFIEKIGILLFCSILEAVVFSMSLILFLFQKDKGWKGMDAKTRNEIFFLIILGTTGTFCLNFAITKTSIIVFAFMGLIEPIIGILVSIFYHKEKINKLQFVGLALGLVSSFVLSFL